MRTKTLNIEIKKAIRFIKIHNSLGDAMEVLEKIERLSNPVTRFACTFDGETAIDCVLDDNLFEREDCTECESNCKIKAKEDCSYWKEITEYKK